MSEISDKRKILKGAGLVAGGFALLAGSSAYAASTSDFALVEGIQAFTSNDYSTHEAVYLKFHTQSNDGGAGIFTKNNAANWTSANNGTRIIDSAGNKWERDESESTYVNVKWFGAMGDGSTNDTPAIQAAIDYAHDSTYDYQGKKTIFIPTPEVGYVVSGLDCKQRINVIGENKWNTRIVVRGQGQFAFENPHLISNLWLDGESIADANSGSRIHESNWSRSSRGNTGVVLGPADGNGQGGHGIVEECRITNFSVGVERGTSIHTSVRDCYISNCRFGIFNRADSSKQFASQMTDHKNYILHCKGPCIGFYEAAGADGYTNYSFDHSVLESSCIEPEFNGKHGFFDTFGASVKSVTGRSVYFEAADETPNAIGMRAAAFSLEGFYFEGFKEPFVSPSHPVATKSYWRCMNGNIGLGTGTFDVTVNYPAGGRNMFMNVSFSLGLDPANLGFTTLIDCSGTNVLPDEGNTNNHWIDNGQLQVRSTTKPPLSLNCSGSNNELARFQKGGVDQATLEVSDNDLILSTQKDSSAIALRTKNFTGEENKVVLNMEGHWFPTDDNRQRLGSPSGKWSEIYAGTGVINTSDINEKQQIQDLSLAEEKVAKHIKKLMKTFRFNDAVNRKGENARIHVGVMAQDVRDAFLSEGLDPHQYALFCEDSWYEDENGKPIDSSLAKSSGIKFSRKTKLGIRYSELLAFVIAAV